MVFSDLFFGECPLAQVQNQRGLALVHLRLKAAFVEGPAERIKSIRVAPSSEGDKSSTALDRNVSLMLFAHHLEL